MALVLSVEQVHDGHIIDADGFLRLLDRQEPLGNVLFELHLGFGVVLLGCFVVGRVGLLLDLFFFKRGLM